MPTPPRRVTSSAVSSIVPAIPSTGRGPPRIDRPVTYTVAPASPRASAIPRPHPRLAPATNATLPLTFSDIARLLRKLRKRRGHLREQPPVIESHRHHRVK